MALPSIISGPLAEVGLEAGIAIARRLIEAIAHGNEAEWRPIAELLPKDLETKVLLAAEREKTRQELAKELG
jgi:hypothetical protein